jgi:hypothetical protein
MMNKNNRGIDQLKKIARHSGLLSLLDRIGLYQSVVERLKWLASSTERKNWRLTNQDYQACRAQFQRIAQVIPAGKPGKVVLSISSFPTVWGWKLEGVLALALRLRNFSPHMVELRSSSWGRRYHQLLGQHHFVNFYKILAHVPAVQPTAELVEFKHSQPTVRDLLGLTYRQIDIGRIALSNLLNRHKFARFDLARPETKTEVYADLLQIQRNVIAAERLLDQIQPTLALVLEKGLSPAAEIVGACLARGTPVVQYVNAQESNRFVLKRFTLENRHQHPFSLSASTWHKVKQMPWSPAREIELMQDLAYGYQSGTWFNRKFLHQNKQIKSAATVRRQLGLNPTKKTAVVFSHVLWDATFFYGEGLFDDYETWLLQTVRAACANRQVNWVIKLHPDLVWKLKYENYTGELRDVIALRSEVGQLPEHVKLVMPSTDISTYSFFAVTDYCLTVRGTIGIEMACHGVPVLTAGTGRYSGLGFTLDSSSPAEYLQRLTCIQEIPPMAPKQIELARRFAYVLFKLRPWLLNSFETTKMSIEQTGHPLDHNLVSHVETSAAFAAAPDIKRFSDWIMLDQIDYLNTEL